MKPSLSFEMIEISELPDAGMIRAEIRGNVFVICTEKIREVFVCEFSHGDSIQIYEFHENKFLTSSEKIINKENLEVIRKILRDALLDKRTVRIKILSTKD